MRKEFAKALLQAAEKNPDILLLTGDLGFSVLEPFIERFPKRFFNMGVAEQNMIGVAAGLALSGKKPFVYSVVPFATMRCYEHIRNDVCYQNVDVKIVGVGEGVSYGADGPTHHSIVDIAIMRSLPNMTVVCPGDPIEAYLATKALADIKGPAYLRIGKSKEPVVHKEEPKFEIGKAIQLRKGSDATLVGTGNMLPSALLAAEELSEKGVECTVLSMHTIKPIDKAAILRAAKETKAIFAIEEHSLFGGLGSTVAEVLAESAKKATFKRIALPDEFASKVGSQQYIRQQTGLSVEAIVEKVLAALKK